MGELKKDDNYNISIDTVLLFDMDGTLVDTDFANFSSYTAAIHSVIGPSKKIKYNPHDRFNRTILKAVFPHLKEVELLRIIQEKEENYQNYLPHTKLNKSVAEILIKYHRTNKTVLVTNCREDRALMTLNYHNLTDKFSHFFCRQSLDNEIRMNKYQNVISSLDLSAETVIAFENEEKEIEDAILAGISVYNISRL